MVSFYKIIESFSHFDHKWFGILYFLWMLLYWTLYQNRNIFFFYMLKKWNEFGWKRVKIKIKMSCYITDEPDIMIKSLVHKSKRGVIMSTSSGCVIHESNLIHMVCITKNLQHKHIHSWRIYPPPQLVYEQLPHYLP